MIIHRAYRTELDPTNVQRTTFLRASGCARYAYNFALGRKQDVYLMNQLPLPRIKSPNRFDLHRELNARKKMDLAWMYESPKWAPQYALEAADRAYDNFFKGRAGFPSFTSRHHGIGSFRLYPDRDLPRSPLIDAGACHIKLSGIGLVRLKQHGYFPEHPAHPLSITISEHAGRWYASLAVEEEMPDPTPPTGSPVGVDLGINHLATVSDGTVFENPKALNARQRKLVHLQREVSRKEKGSKNREKAKRRLSRCHAKVTNVRNDAIHKATTSLARTKSVIVVETLRPANMMKNHSLARSLSDASFGEFVRQMEYKTGWYGSCLVKADPFCPSTKKCSGCGAIKEMSLADRTYECSSCGLVIDRDLNASRNLASVAASSAETENACGAIGLHRRSGVPGRGIRNPATTAPVVVV